MPELPEVETTRRSLAPVLEGATITTAEVGRPRMLRHQPRPEDFADRMRGRRVESLGRRGKFLLGHMEGDLTLVLHLGMSGRMRIEVPGAERPPHTNVALATDEAEVWMIDPRTFGFVVCLTPDEWDGSPFAELGPDALDELPRSPLLGAALTRRRSPLKALLLDQHLLAGLGN
ncbi:MAG: DNA-formamidopyrimidine glycosylase, partial [Acidimicrobiia bacterium]|nr:DNA-formamidopyrimidine glycosylase [Acidimicrobiia bacterium]